MKGIIKANTADRYLSPIRAQICDMIQAQSEVIEFGCGNGDLLFKLAPHIKSGLGVDINTDLIDYANSKKSRGGVSNISFEVKDITDDLQQPRHYDYAIASLLFHVIPWSEAVELLGRMKAVANTIVICGFCKPTSKKDALLLWLDQRFSGHYANFKAFSRNGYMSALLDEVKPDSVKVIDTFDPVIKLYKIN